MRTEKVRNWDPDLRSYIEMIKIVAGVAVLEKQIKLI